MGDPVQIVDLVHNYAEQMKLPRPRDPLHRPAAGEKLAEKAVLGARRGCRARIRRSGRPGALSHRRTSRPLLDRLYTAAHDGDLVLAKELFRQLVPEYVPSDRRETLVSAGAPYPDGF